MPICLTSQSVLWMTLSGLKGLLHPWSFQGTHGHQTTGGCIYYFHSWHQRKQGFTNFKAMGALTLVAGDQTSTTLKGGFKIHLLKYISAFLLKTCPKTTTSMG